jgi:hypothetical protein
MLIACRTDPDDSAAAKESTICEVFYRAGGERSFESAPPIIFSGGTEKKFHAFDEQAFETWFQDDEFEGHSLFIVIVNLENDSEIVRQLYQFVAQKPVENQFVGGHGFTGLNYVFKPKATDEIQYSCSVE